MTGKDELKKTASILNNTDFKLLMWSKNEHETWKSGLKDCRFIDKLRLSTTGGETFTLYIYAKIGNNLFEEPHWEPSSNISCINIVSLSSPSCEILFVQEPFNKTNKATITPDAISVG